MREVILIDTSNLCYSVYFTHQTLETEDKRPTGVIYGFFQSLISIRKKFPGASMVFCLDGKGTTWRHKRYPEYKATRPKNSEVRQAVRAQMPVILKTLRIFGFKIVEVDCVEADDIIGILSHHLSRRYLVKIYSNDKDFYQLISDKVKVYKRINSKTIEVKPAYIMEEFGVMPEQWTRFRALMGDLSDGIKPLAGVGPKTAVKMLNAGIDPAKFYFRYNSRKACAKYRHLEHSWQKIRAAFAVSEIVQHENFFSGQSRKDLVAALNLVDDPRRNPEKSHDVLYSAFIDLCAEYELESLLSSRYDLFKIP